MKVLITGGAGFIGTNLIHHLNRTAPEMEILVFDNESLGKEACLKGLSYQFIKGDIRDKEALMQALAGVDAVVHLAADTRVIDSIEDPAFNFENNVVGSFNLLQAMRACGVNRIICASTGGAIIGEAEPPVHELMVPNPSSPYGASKMMLEGYLSAFAQSYGMQCTALRFSNVYGPYSFHKGSVVAAFMKQIMQGEDIVIYGDGEQTRDYVFSFDLCEGIKKAILHDGPGDVYQLGTGVGTSLNQLIDVIEDIVGADYPVNRIYKDARAGEIKFTYCQIDKAKASIDYDPQTDVRAGLEKTWQWFLEQGPNA